MVQRSAETDAAILRAAAKLVEFHGRPNPYRTWWGMASMEAIVFAKASSPVLGGIEQEDAFAVATRLRGLVSAAGRAGEGYADAVEIAEAVNAVDINTVLDEFIRTLPDPTGADVTFTVAELAGAGLPAPLIWVGSQQIQREENQRDFFFGYAYNPDSDLWTVKVVGRAKKVSERKWWEFESETDEPKPIAGLEELAADALAGTAEDAVAEAAAICERWGEDAMAAAIRSGAEEQAWSLSQGLASRTE